MLICGPEKREHNQAVTNTGGNGASSKGAGSAPAKNAAIAPADDLERLKAIGKEWTGGDNHRIYFNDLRSLYGLDATYYGTGNISSASIDGVAISNGKARALATDLDFAKVWYDVKTKTFNQKGLSDSVFERIVATIRRRM